MKSSSSVILLVEDDPNDILFFERAIKKITGENIQLMSVSDGELAIKYLTGEGEFSNRDSYPLPELVVLDLKLPRRSGFEVLAWTKEHESLSAMPVVIFTSSNQISDIAKAYEIGANSYLVKPIGFKKLTDVIQSICTYWININMSPVTLSEQ